MGEPCAGGKTVPTGGQPTDGSEFIHHDIQSRPASAHSVQKRCCAWLKSSWIDTAGVEVSGAPGVAGASCLVLIMRLRVAGSWWRRSVAMMRRGAGTMQASREQPAALPERS